MINSCFFRKYAAILALSVSAVLFLPIACTKSSSAGEKPETGVITMTTMDPDVSFDIGLTLGTDSLVIDWGNGEGSKAYATLSEPSCCCYLKVSHSYSESSEHNITITSNGIEYLDCAMNQLTNLDVSRNTVLTHLRCEYNQLTTLDVSRNRTIKELACFNNQLTTLNVSNTALTDLCCNHNQLSTLDVSNTALIYLYCVDNRLTVTALNELFRTLPKRTDLQTKHSRYPDPLFTLYIHDNPGTSDCDVSIAQEKRWKVYPPLISGER